MFNVFTRNEQREFIYSLTSRIGAELIQQIEAGKIPEDWNGIELRQLLADKFAESTATMDRKRKSQYHNTVIVNNL